MTRPAVRTARVLAAVAVTLAPVLARAQAADTDKAAAPVADTDRPAKSGKATPATKAAGPAQPGDAGKQPAAAATATAPAGTSAAASSADQRPRLLARGSRRRGFRTSIDDYVEQVFRSHEDPCAKAAREGVPCFPVSIDQEGPRFSVAEAMRRYRVDGGPAPNQQPTTAELQQQMSGAPQSASGGVSFDPACTVKSLMRSIRGGSSTFYLYRTWNGDVERPLLTDHKLDPNTYARLPNFRYEFVGEFKGECDAVAAWRAAQRNPTPPPQ